MAIESVYEVAIIDATHRYYLEDPDIEQAELRGVANVVLYRVDSPAGLVGRIENADAIISWNSVALRSQVISGLRRCRGIVRAAVGFDNIDILAAAEQGIPVCNIPDYGTEEVADHALAMMLCLVRNLYGLHEHVKTGGWAWQSIGSIPRVRGMKLGIIGFGRIGGAVARRAQAFGMEVAFYDPYVPDGTDKSRGAERCEDLHQLISQSNIISIHTPLTSETHHLIGRRELGLMNNSTILVNTSRGEVVDQEALVESVVAKKLRLVALDVLETEPRVPEELRRAEGVLLSPHAAFYSDCSLRELRWKAARAARAFLLGGLPRTVVNNVRQIRDDI
jgi:C-terminal binding protein